MSTGDVGEEGQRAAGPGPLPGAPTEARLAGAIAQAASAMSREGRLPAATDAIVEQAVGLLGARAAHLFLPGGRGLKLAAERRLPAELVERLRRLPLEDAHPIARAAALGAVIVRVGADDDPAPLPLVREGLERTGSQSFIALPLLARERLVGVLGCYFAERSPFPPDDLATLRPVADVFAMGLASAVAQETERRLHAQLDAVGLAAIAISSELELGGVLQAVVDQARVVAEARYAALGIVAGPGEPFSPWVQSGVSGRAAAAIGRLPGPVGLLGAVAASGSPLRVADMREHAAFQGLPAGHPEMHSFLGVPIRYRGKSVGNLYLSERLDGEEFSAEDQSAIELLAAHAGAALERSHLATLADTERARFATLLESAPQGILLLDRASGEIVANPPASRLFGHLRATGPAGVDLDLELEQPDGTPLRADERPYRRALAGQVVPAEELLAVLPDGRRVPILMSAVPVRSQEGTVGGAVVLFEDLSAHKELEALREAWTAGIVHDLRQPLTVIALQLSVLERLLASDEPAARERKAFHRVRSSTASLTRMVEDLLDQSRLLTGHLQLDLEPVELCALVREIVERMDGVAGSSPIRLVAEDCASARVRADPVRLEQVLVNLLSNAARYGTEFAEIRVEVRSLPGEAEVSVSNQGPGISAEDLTHVFTRFFRARTARRGGSGGLGLGLYIAKGLVEAHGGRIWMESVPGETTSVRFRVPVAGEPVH